MKSVRLFEGQKEIKKSCKENLMRIAFINTYANGSTGRIVDSLKEICAKAGHEVISYYGRGYCSTPQNSEKHMSTVGHYADAILTRVFDTHGLNNKRNTRKLISSLRTFKPDIVHIHNLHGYWINYPMLFRYVNRNNIKVVWTLHDCWSFTGHCTHFDYIKCNKWQNLCHHCEQKTEYPKSLICDRSRKNYLDKKKAFTLLDKQNMHIVTPSQWLADNVKQSFLSKYPVSVINNGIDLNVFKPQKSTKREQYGIEERFVVLGVASYWNERKGLKYILEVAQRKPEWIFVIIGDLGQSQGETIEADNLVFVPRTESVNDLAEWYSTADVYVNPTLEDTYPTTNLEAIACGTPVVTFPTGGSVEIVQVTNFGTVCKDKTAKALSDAIEYVICQKKEAQNYDTNLLDCSTKFNEYLTLYLKVYENDKN